jgi:hypothetical protein
LLHREQLLLVEHDLSKEKLFRSRHGGFTPLPEQLLFPRLLLGIVRFLALAAARLSADSSPVILAALGCCVACTW